LFKAKMKSEEAKADHPLKWRRGAADNQGNDFLIEKEEK
jgi:hypothetical protein